MTITPLRDTLPNGLLVVAIERPWSRTATLSIDVRVGARYEAPDDAGLSHFLEHMVFQGCAAHPSPEAVNEACERLGSALDASTSREHTHFEHWVPAVHLEESAHLVADILKNPLFMSIDTERDIVLEEALDEFDGDGRRVDADTLSRRAVWPHVALGQSIIGELSHLRRFDVDDLKRHHTAFYGARNMVATIVGPRPAEALIQIVRDAFGGLPPGERRVPESPKAPLEGPIIELVRDHRSQCDCRLLMRTPGRQNPAAPALALLRVALDDGLASRMHRRLGADLGLAYDQWATWEYYPDTGAFELGAQVSPSKALTFFEEAIGLVRGLADDPPTGDELERIRFRARWALESTMETADGLVSLYGTPLLWWDEAPDPEVALAELEAVTSQTLAATARGLLDARNMVACCVGAIDKATRRGIRARLNRLANPE